MKTLGNIIMFILDVGENIWKSKFGDVLKVIALWGFVVFLIGAMFRSDAVACFGLGMCLGFFGILTIFGIFGLLVVIIFLFHSLLAYTERVLFDKNRIF